MGLDSPAHFSVSRLLSVAARWCLLWLIAGASPNLFAAIYQAGAWPLEVTVTPDKSEIMLGEPTWLSYAVRNSSDEDLQILVGGDYRNELGRPASFEVKTLRADGKWVSQPDAGPNSGGLMGPKNLPAGGSYVFRLFVPHWATFKETGAYTISCRRTLQVLRPVTAGDFRQQATVDVVADARTTLIVQPRDERRMGQLVTDLGETMLRADGDKPGDDAVVALAWIEDERVVPYFRRALSIRSYALRFIAIQALAKFSSDEAVEGLRAALLLKPSDFDYASGEAQPELAANLRAAAAGALTRSKHPGALPLLVAQRRDESENVRLTVLRALSRMPPADALPILQEMTRDQSSRVSDEATRFVALLRRQTDARERTR